MPKTLRLLFAALILMISLAAQAGNFSPRVAKHTPLTFYQTIDDAKFARWLLTAGLKSGDAV
jgi:hypothetical protein